MDIKFQNTRPLNYNRTGDKPVSFRGWQDQSDSTKLYIGNEVGSAISTAISAVILAPVMHFFSLKLFKTDDLIPDHIAKDIAEEMVNDPENKFNEDTFYKKGKFAYYFSNKPEPKPTTIDSLRNFFSDHFNPAENKAYAHINRPSVILHEIGHGIDWNKSFLTNLLTRTRFKALAIAGFLVPLAFWHRNSGEKNDFGDWINKHIGTVSFLSFVPTLITEASASKKGYQYLKKYAEKCPEEVTQEMLKNFSTRMKWAFGTYAATALLTPVAIKLGIMVKDKIASPSNNTQEIQQPYVRYYNQ